MLKAFHAVSLVALGMLGMVSAAEDCTGKANLFFSEYAEGTSHNKYLEIYNADSCNANLDGYGFPNVANAPDDPGKHEYWNTFTADLKTDKKILKPGEIFIIAHPEAKQTILDKADQTHKYLSNGDDGYCLVYGSEASYEKLDCIGNFTGDPGWGWNVCGISEGTQDHTLLRKSTVSAGNKGDWAMSAGTSSDDCQWLVMDQDWRISSGDWASYGSWPKTISPTPAPTPAPTFTGTLCSNKAKLFFSEYAEGSSHNKYLEIYNADNCNANLEEYGFPSVANAPDDNGKEHDYWNGFTADLKKDKILKPGKIFIIAHPDAAQSILDKADQTHKYLSNGDDGYCLVYGSEASYEKLDCIGNFTGDPGAGWSVCGISDGTKEHTLLRKSSVDEGNKGDWAMSAGTSSDDCQWLVMDRDWRIESGDWASYGSWPKTISPTSAPTIKPSTVSDDVCFKKANLFFSEYAEGTLHNKYLQIYNADNCNANLEEYGFPSVANGPDVVGKHDYWNGFTADLKKDKILKPGKIYIIAHPEAAQSILEKADQTHKYLSNGNDGYCLVYGSDAKYEKLDCIGNYTGDPGSGWDVCGTSAATKDKTLLRKASVSAGNKGDWAKSAGTNSDDCEWMVMDRDWRIESGDWASYGSWPKTMGPAPAPTPAASPAPPPAASPAPTATTEAPSPAVQSVSSTGMVSLSAVVMVVVMFLLNVASL